MAPGLLRVAPRMTHLVRRPVAFFTEAPPCGVCGKGHAHGVWQIDPLGGPHGVCPGCIPDDPAYAPRHWSRKQES
jgi:hypothetical protein